MWHRFQNIFPTPSFLSMPGVGIDISDQSLKFVELKQSGTGLVLHRYGNERIPDGVVVSGKIQDRSKLESILRTLRQKNNFDFVRISMPEEQVYLFTLQVPVVGEGLREAIELSLEEHVPISALDAIFDFDIIKKTAHDTLVDVSVISREIAESYMGVFKAAGFTPLSLELEAAAIARSVVRKGDTGTYLVMDMGERRTGVAIVSQNCVHFATTVDIGGATLTEIVAKSFSLSLEEAEQMKKDSGLLRTPQNRELFSTLLSPLSILRDEINKQYVYWHTHPDEAGNERPKIEKLILCGGDANLRGIVDYFSTSLRVPTEYANPWVNIQSLDSYIPPLSFGESLSYTTALGLALRNFIHE